MRTEGRKDGRAEDRRGKKDGWFDRKDKNIMKEGQKAGRADGWKIQKLAGTEGIAGEWERKRKERRTEGQTDGRMIRERW